MVFSIALRILGDRSMAEEAAQRVHAVGHLGMGLDEKAVAAVKQYKFKPATLQGRPVPVEVNVEVDFRIY